MLKNFLNTGGHQNPISDSKAKAILQKRWSLPIGGVACGRVGACSLRSRLVFLGPFWYWCYYPHRIRDSVSPVCCSFFVIFHSKKDCIFLNGSTSVLSKVFIIFFVQTLRLFPVCDSKPVACRLYLWEKNNNFIKAAKQKCEWIMQEIHIIQDITFDNKGVQENCIRTPHLVVTLPKPRHQSYVTFI